MESELDVPRDRNSEFEPRVVKKRQTLLDLQDKIAMCSNEMTNRDIQELLFDMYGM